MTPWRRAKMVPNTLGEMYGLQQHRRRIETVNSQLAAWGTQQLHARTHDGWVLKVLASLVALLCVNAF